MALCDCPISILCAASPRCSVLGTSATVRPRAAGPVASLAEDVCVGLLVLLPLRLALVTCFVALRLLLVTGHLRAQERVCRPAMMGADWLHHRARWLGHPGMMVWVSETPAAVSSDASNSGSGAHPLSSSTPAWCPVHRQAHLLLCRVCLLRMPLATGAHVLLRVVLGVGLSSSSPGRCMTGDGQVHDGWPTQPSTL